MSAKYNYASLSNLDITRESDKENYSKDVRLILKEFLFKKLELSNLEVEDEKDLMLVRHSIINFFYCGKFTLKCQNPIIYDDNAQKELFNVSNTANEIGTHSSSRRQNAIYTASAHNIPSRKRTVRRFKGLGQARSCRRSGEFIQRIITFS